MEQMGLNELTIRTISEAKCDVDLAHAKKHLAGMLFEQFAYQYLAAKNKGSNKLLTNDETVGFYRELYPNNKVIYHSTELETDGIEGISVPDLLLVNRFGIIKAVYHCTARRDIDNSEQLIVASKSDKLRHPSFFSNDCTFNIVTTSNANLDIWQGDDSSQIKLPISGRELGEIVNEIWVSATVGFIIQNPS
ncbi:MAG: hypothetical protein AAB656_00365 [Patescibacteria group bacterium]